MQIQKKEKNVCVCVCVCENIENWATVARPLSVSNQMSVVQIATMFCYGLAFSPRARQALAY